MERERVLVTENGIHCTFRGSPIDSFGSWDSNILLQLFVTGKIAFDIDP